MLLVPVGLLLNCNLTPDHRGGSYLETEHWQRYQKFLPESMRFNANNLPTESYVEIFNNRIHLDRYGNDTLPCKFILLHGGGGNGRILGPIAVMLYRAGCTVVAPDLPGYGLTVTNETQALTYETWVKTVSTLMNLERKKGQKFYLMGLSMGGLLAYQAVALNGKADGLLVTTLVDPRRQEVRDAVSANLFLSRIVTPINEWFSIFTDYLYMPIAAVSKMEQITNDPEFSEVFATDPHAGGGWVSSRFLRTFMNYSPAIEPEDFNICPVWLAHPGLDPWTPLSMSQPFYDKLAAEKKLIILDGAGHLPYEEPGRSILEKTIRNLIANKGQVN